MDSLPQELIDEIIGFLPLDRNLLSNCSLVAEPWRDISQKRLFRSVRTGPRNLRWWLDDISRKNIKLLGYVRELTCFMEELFTMQQIEPAHGTLQGHSPLLPQLKHFTLWYTDVQSLSWTRLISDFKYSLLTITLFHCTVSNVALVALINYFPNLKSLYLEDLSYTNSHESTSLSSRTLLEKLYVRDYIGSSLDLLNELSELGLCSEEVALSVFAFPDNLRTTFVNRVVRAFGASVKFLRLPQMSNNPGLFTLSPCRELRELEVEVSVYHLHTTELGFISSVTSTNIEKIIINSCSLSNDSVRDTFWTQLDDILIELVERLGSEIRLEVEFRGNWDVGAKIFDQKKSCLPRFVEKGRMIVRDCWNRPIYSSDHPGERR